MSLSAFADVKMLPAEDEAREGAEDGTSFTDSIVDQDCAETMSAAV
jgi:hypothetical protein